jgi:hypothetical protein
MQMEDRSLIYELGDVLPHFKGVSIFLEAATQHATREQEEAIYCPSHLYKDREIICEHLARSGFMDNYFIWSKHDETEPRTENIIDDGKKRTRMQIMCIVIMMMEVIRMMYVRMMKVLMWRS